MGEEGDETIILNSSGQREDITIQHTQMGKTTTRYLHPDISTFIGGWEVDLTFSGKQYTDFHGGLERLKVMLLFIINR